VESGFFPCEPRELRLGIFPTAANPIHWAHLLGGLVAMDRFHLDKVIFVIAGDHSKLEMASEDARHSMAKQVLALFDPLFEYSSIARGTIVSGEENLFKILGLNPTQAIHAFYIAGGDHYHRIDPASRLPDTIQKLEDGIISRLHGFNERLHRVSAVFLDRKSEERDIPTLLDVRHVGKLAVQTSSTAIRMALEDQRRRRDLYTLPFTGLASICHNNLYHVRRAGKLRALHRVP
jgi:nicotinic acid mononucleotide adenylyltransferase